MNKYERGIRSLKASERFLTALLFEVSNPRKRGYLAATVNGLRICCETAEQVAKEQEEAKHGEA